MHSVQSVTKQTKLSRRQRRRHRNSTAVSGLAATGSQLLAAETALTTAIRDSAYKIPKSYRNTVPIVHGIIVSNLSLVLLQKEYIEQFYFEKRSGGGGPDPDEHAYADFYRHLNKYSIKLQRLRFG